MGKLHIGKTRQEFKVAKTPLILRLPLAWS